MDEKPKKGTLALCGLGCLGIITDDEPKKVKYADGNEGVAYIGIHVSNDKTAIGSPWSSRKPKIVGHVDDVIKAWTNCKNQNQMKI